MNTKMLVIGIVLLIVGLIAYVQFSSANTACKGTMMGIAKFLNPTTAASCASYQSYMYISIFVAIIGVVLSIAGLVSNKNSHGHRR